MVALVILIFLWHIPSAVIPIVTIPIAVLISFIAHAHDGDELEHHVAGRHRHRRGRHGGRRHRGGGADPQEAGDGGRQLDDRRLPARHRRRRQGSGRPQLLRAAGDRGLVPAGADAGSAGGPPVQAAGVHQELRHDRGGGAGHHARPGAAAAVLPQGQLPAAAAMAGAHRQRRAGGQDPFRGEAPHQPRADARCTSRWWRGACAGNGW